MYIQNQEKSLEKQIRPQRRKGSSPVLADIAVKQKLLLVTTGLIGACLVFSLGVISLAATVEASVPLAQQDVRIQADNEVQSWFEDRSKSVTDKMQDLYNRSDNARLLALLRYVVQAWDGLQANAGAQDPFLKQQKILAFKVRDFVLWKAHMDTDLYRMIAKAFPTGIAGLEYKRILPVHSHFFFASSHNDGKVFRHNDDFKIHADTASLRQYHMRPSQLRVLHVAHEASTVQFGGVGSYIEGLVKNENQVSDEFGDKLMSADMITPCYDVLMRDLFEKLEFVGIIPVAFEAPAKHSCVYRYRDPKTEAWQYLVAMDHSLNNQKYQELEKSKPRDWESLKNWQYFDIGESKELYNHFDNEVWLYFSSAAAFFAGLYKGEGAQSGYDVIQVNDWHLAGTTMLIQQYINEARKEAMLPELATVATTHELNQSQGQDGAWLYGRLGLPMPEGGINLQAAFNLHADISNTVSKAIADEMAHPQLGFGLDHIFQTKREVGKFQGITNGIDLGGFDITSEQVLGSFAVRADLSDLLEKKVAAKQFLASVGKISNPEQILLLYVGRFSHEKGIDVFEHLKDIVRGGGFGVPVQTVLMGAPVNDDTRGYMEWIRNETQGLPFKVYMGGRAEQCEEVDTGNGKMAKIGLLMRFAADVTLVPSIEESCGLVPIEAMAMGSLVVSSHVHGLKDVIDPADYSRPGLMVQIECGDASGFSFCRSTDRNATGHSLYNDMRRVFGEINNVRSSSAYLTSLQNIVNRSKNFEWKSEGRGVYAYYGLYQDAFLPLIADHEEEMRQFYIKHFNKNNSSTRITGKYFNYDIYHRNIPSHIAVNKPVDFVSDIRMQFERWAQTAKQQVPLYDMLDDNTLIPYADGFFDYLSSVKTITANMHSILAQYKTRGKSAGEAYFNKLIRQETGQDRLVCEEKQDGQEEMSLRDMEILRQTLRTYIVNLTTVWDDVQRADLLNGNTAGDALKVYAFFRNAFDDPKSHYTCMPAKDRMMTDYWKRHAHRLTYAAG